MAPMGEYRLVPVISGTDIINGATVRVVCQSDTEAIEEAYKRLNDLDIEIWHVARCVTRIAARDPR
jgi:hypothetical protein